MVWARRRRCDMPSSSPTSGAASRKQSISALSPQFQFLYAGDILIAEYGSGGLLYRYVPSGLGEDKPLAWYQGTDVNTRAWLLGDQQGAVIASVDSSGNLGTA